MSDISNDLYSTVLCWTIGEIKNDEKYIVEVGDRVHGAAV
jgi:hypothetical protein